MHITIYAYGTGNLGITSLFINMGSTNENEILHKYEIVWPRCIAWRHRGEGTRESKHGHGNISKYNNKQRF